MVLNFGFLIEKALWKVLHDEKAIAGLYFAGLKYIHICTFLSFYGIK